ncbi:hypothetical protein [Caulobacter phage Cr30]|uniref:hypothetical protein n=1 Tax=Caulobacter phage Cr30 TaxID=1357714 RepID=UPI0004A9B8E5|nr:hypothetical protein OZ74_gp189 [Caulobacter phage Cr30]AGS81154.1 hypothetical protein [Caulobacter phage Cr30]
MLIRKSNCGWYLADVTGNRHSPFYPSEQQAVKVLEQWQEASVTVAVEKNKKSLEFVAQV